jgi:hypothetical protein
MPELIGIDDVLLAPAFAAAWDDLARRAAMTLRRTAPDSRPGRPALQARATARSTRSSFEPAPATRVFPFDGCSCPTPAVRDTHWERLSWVVSRPSPGVTPICQVLRSWIMLAEP